MITIDITKNKIYYHIPPEAISIIDIQVKNHLNSKDEYRSIPRMLYKPKVKDED